MVGTKVRSHEDRLKLFEELDRDLPRIIIAKNWPAYFHKDCFEDMVQAIRVQLWNATGAWKSYREANWNTYANQVAYRAGQRFIKRLYWTKSWKRKAAVISETDYYWTTSPDGERGFLGRNSSSVTDMEGLKAIPMDTKDVDTADDSLVDEVRGKLTQAERKIWDLVADGYTFKQIAKRLKYSSAKCPSTILAAAIRRIRKSYGYEPRTRQYKWRFKFGKADTGDASKAKERDKEVELQEAA